MTKHEFLGALKTRLSQLPPAEVERFLSYYGEMIDDRVEDGMTEEAAVAAMEDVSVIAERILYDTPLHTLVKATAKEKMEKTSFSKTWQATTIILLVLGFPLWFPLLLALGSVALTVFVVFWVVILSLLAAVVAVAFSGVVAVGVGIILLFSHPIAGLALTGCGLGFAGLCILLFFGVKACVKGLIYLSKRFGHWIKSLFIKKGEAK